MRSIFGHEFSGPEKPWIVRGAADKGNVRRIVARIAHPRNLNYLAWKNPGSGEARQMREMSSVLRRESRTPGNRGAPDHFKKSINL
jgi:hypothetical protein